MIKKIHTKLSSNKGASLLLVLGLFLVCIMVSSVVVATASVGASRSAYRTQQQQAYLSLSSAVELVAEDMGTVLQNTYSEKIRVIDYGCNDVTLAEGESFLEANKTITIEGAAEPVTYIGTPLHEDILSHREISGTSYYGGLLYAVLDTACQKVYADGTNYEEEFWIYPQNSDERFPKVQCKFVMDPSYNIFIAFAVEGSDQTMTMEFDALINDNGGSLFVSETPFSCPHNIIYDDNVTVKRRDYPGKETVYEIKISWDTTPLMKRGLTDEVE